MYLARVKKEKTFTYILRESIKEEQGMGFRDIVDLGPRPGAWIDYPGRNAWYLSPDLESKILDISPNTDPDHIEDLFWPFVRSEVRRATRAFRQRAESSKFNPMDKKEKENLARAVHRFDKRRAHFLKLGNMDQGPLVNMPPVLFKRLKNKSRDEIEQDFMAQEKAIKPKDLKSYVYTIFDLQRFFKGFLAKQMPHAMDQNKVETFFIKELCQLNKEFFSLTTHLHEYLARYAIMFFDHSYGDTVLLDDMEKDFRFRHRFFTPRPKPSVSFARAREMFNLGKTEFKSMDKKTLTRKFRQLARKHHPDKGGDDDTFIKINEAYQALLKKI
ncbi:MAG: J domain-containing protein [Desulfobacter sp.]|nr:J domain-containing protein [Desulfobacter sp.]WDP88011.1 MAG: J domain-containing protein [Desulfobacter sp.]